MSTSVIEAMDAPEAVNFETHGVFITLDKTGDSKHIWDRNNSDEVAVARDMFESFKKKGYTAYHVKGDGSKGEVMREFDKKAEKVIFAPRVVGG